MECCGWLWPNDKYRVRHYHYKLCRIAWQLAGMAGPTIVNPKIAALHPTELRKCVSKDCYPGQKNRIAFAKGYEHPDFRAFTDRLKTGRYWTKISGADRNTRTGRPYADTAPYMRAIVQAAPDQVVWGSDWPHVGHSAETMPDLADLLRLLHECVPDEAIRRKILIDTPTRLYNF